jgi:hypothetical protein
MQPKCPQQESKHHPLRLVAGQEPKVRKLSTVKGRPHYCAPQVDSLEGLRDLDLGPGTPVNYGRTEHQAMHKVWGTELDGSGHFQAIDLQ